MIVFDLCGASDIAIDYDLVRKEAANIGQDTFEMWNQVLVKAQDEVVKHK